MQEDKDIRPSIIEIIQYVIQVVYHCHVQSIKKNGVDFHSEESVL